MKKTSRPGAGSWSRALSEFSEKGYGGQLSEHHLRCPGDLQGDRLSLFENKDQLYLSCVEECFQRLTAHLSAALQAEEPGPVEEQLGRYFTARMDFFQETPVYQPIFCEAVISPPGRLLEQIQACGRTLTP